MSRKDPSKNPLLDEMMTVVKHLIDLELEELRPGFASELELKANTKHSLAEIVVAKVQGTDDLPSI
jgi:hypothetical protein